MHLFTMSGSRVMEIPSVLDEVMKLDSALTNVKAQEGERYSTCRSIDNNKYPLLNHANYPNLYAATLEWAKRTKKVQKNYLGSKSLIDQAINQDVVRKVLKMTVAQMGAESLTEEQRAWLRERKGYTIPDIPLSQALADTRYKRPADVLASDTSSSESEDEQDTKRGGRAKRHRRQ